VSAATVIAEHQFKNNPELEPVDDDGKTRPMRRRCPACADEGKKKLTPKRCFHKQCFDHRYKAGGKWVTGIFYCPDHYNVHYSAVLNGNSDV
jgi:hypothetical protein